jgi:hypothetical protein
VYASWDSSVGIRVGRMTGVRFLASARAFSLQRPRPVMKSTQPPIHWVPGAFSPRDKRNRGVKLTAYLYVVPTTRMVEHYLHSHTCLRRIVLNYISTWIVLCTFNFFRQGTVRKITLDWFAISSIWDVYALNFLVIIRYTAASKYSNFAIFSMGV